jgi:DNA segregation ATPase FtsK/SpoIIIE-like protein
MGFYNDDDLIDDDDYFDDAEELDDDDEQIDAPRPSVNPFTRNTAASGSSGLPGRDRAGGPSRDPKDAESDRSKIFGNSGTRTPTFSSSSRPPANRDDEPPVRRYNPGGGENRPRTYGGSGESRPRTYSGSPPTRPEDRSRSHSGGGIRDTSENRQPVVSRSGGPSRPSEEAKRPAASTPPPKKDAGDKDDKEEKKGGGNPLSGLKNRLPSGGGIAERVGGLTKRLPIGGSKKDGDGEKKPSAPKKEGDGGIAGRVGGMASGFAGRFRPGARKDDGPSPGAKPAAGGPPGPGPGRVGGTQGTAKPVGGDRQSQLGQSKSGESPDKKTGKGKKEGVGVLASVRSRLPFGGGDKAKKQKQPKVSKTRASKVPHAKQGEGLSLDDKLDILGVGLVFGALVLFFSALSGEQGALTGSINGLITDLVGWGAPAIPLVMAAIGIWLIIRHFGEDAPEIDPVRVSGLAMLYVGALLLFMFIETFNPLYIYATQEEFYNFILQSIESGRGGGYVGGELYSLLVVNVGEVSAVIFIFGWLVVGLMLTTRTSAAELAAFVISIWRSFQLSVERRAQRRRALALEREAQTAVEQEQLRISKPETEALPAGGSAAALPAPENNVPIEQRPIPIKMGGREMQSVPNEVGQTAEDGGRGGLMGGLGRRLRQSLPGSTESESTATSPPPEEKQSPMTAAASIAASATLGGLLGARKEGEPVEETKKPAAPVPAPPPSTPEATPPPRDLFSQLEDDDDDDDEDDEAVATPGNANAFAARMNRLNELRSGEHKHPVADLRNSILDDDDADDDAESDEDDDEVVNATVQPVNPFANGTEKPAAAQPPKQAAPPKVEERPTPQPVINPAPQPTPARQPVASTNPARSQKNWRLPDYRTVLASGSEQEFDRETLVKRARTIEETLQSFGAPGRVVEINTGPVITQFGVEPDYLMVRGGKKNRVKVSAIAALDKDLQLALGAKSIRIEAPVPGKGFVGVEVPNEEASLVSLRDVMESNTFTKIKSPLAIALGQSVDGAPVSADLTDMPHLLIAGTTGSGKSVCVNSIIASLLIRNTPDTVKFIMVDPKRVELTGYNGIPHLVAPVVVELERIVGVLKWVTREMDDRYKRFSNAGARNIEDYNAHKPPEEEHMPYIVVIIDELADLMMLAPEETERVITRIAALARATGIHLVIATQRPSVDVVTGLIKANFPARIAFAVAGGVDSRVILDQPGAERLLGKGDMLYMSGDSPAPLRLQGVFVSDMEINNINRFWKAQSAGITPQKPITALVSDDEPTPQKRPVLPKAEPFSMPATSPQRSLWDETTDPANNHSAGFGMSSRENSEHEDELYDEAVELVRRLNKASVSLLQRRLRIGYTRAARLIDVMEAEGIVGPPTEGSKPRVVLPPKDKEKTNA